MNRPATAAAALLRRLVDDEDGASHLEYALIGAFAGVVMTGAYLTLSGSLDSFYTTLAGILETIPS